METNTRYIELAVGSVANRNEFIEFSSKNIQKHITTNDELFRGMFSLENKPTNGIKSYNGNYMLQELILDIDKGKSPGDKVLNDCKEICNMLIEKGVTKNCIQPWFSGTGFHIHLPNVYGFKPSHDLPQRVKFTINKEFGTLVDNIYDRARLIRIPYSLNAKSNLYKIPVNLDNLLNNKYRYEEIVAKAQIQPVILDFMIVNNKQLTSYPLKEYANQVNVNKPKPVAVSNSKFNSNVTCVQKMWNNDKSGRRHIVLLRMISAWKRMGLTKEATHNLAMLNVPSLSEQEVSRLTDDIYSWSHNGYGCSDVVMAEFCDVNCRYYVNKDFSVPVKSPFEIADTFKQFLDTDFSSSSFNLKDLYDLNHDYKFYPGELAVLIGDTKLGKTAWIQNIVANLKSMPCLYMSLEVEDKLIFRRFLQIANEMTKDEIHDVFMGGNKEEINKLVKQMQHINIITTPPEVSTIKTIIGEHQPKIVVIDTLDGISVKFNNDPFTKMESIINGLKQIAIEQNVIILGVSHISKGALAESNNLTVHSAKGNSVIEQKADKIIGIMGDRDMGRKRIIRSLASRDEAGFHMVFDFEFTTFQFRHVK
mgnify:FL=1